MLIWLWAWISFSTSTLLVVESRQWSGNPHLPVGVAPARPFRPSSAHCHSSHNRNTKIVLKLALFLFTKTIFFNKEPLFPFPNSRWMPIDVLLHRYNGRYNSAENRLSFNTILFQNRFILFSYCLKYNRRIRETTDDRFLPFFLLDSCWFRKSI